MIFRFNKKALGFAGAFALLACQAAFSMQPIEQLRLAQKDEMERWCDVMYLGLLELPPANKDKVFTAVYQLRQTPNVLNLSGCGIISPKQANIIFRALKSSDRDRIDTINLSDNNIDQYPSALRIFNLLRTLDISGNKISAFALDNFSSSNKESERKGFLDQLKALQTLTIDGSTLEFFIKCGDVDLSGLSTLKIVGKVFIGDVASSLKLHNLKNLDLTRSDVRSVPSVGKIRTFLPKLSNVEFSQAEAKKYEPWIQEVRKQTQAQGPEIKISIR